MAHWSRAFVSFSTTADHGGGEEVKTMALTDVKISQCKLL